MSAAPKYPSNVIPMPERPDTFIPAALDESGLDPYAFRLFCRIARRWSPQHGCYESIPEMAKGCQMNVKTARKALAELEARGMVRRQDREGQTARLDPTAPAYWSNPKGATPTKSGRGTKSGSPTKSGTPPLPDQVGKGNPEKVLQKGVGDAGARGATETAKKPEPVPDLWSQFYAAYPVKRKKQDARKAWVKAGLHKDPEKARAIVADVERRKQRDSQWKRGYIPHPSTYINQERWDDELESPTPHVNGTRSGSRDAAREARQRPFTALGGFSDAVDASLGLGPGGVEYPGDEG